MSDTGKGKIDIAQLVKILSLTQSDSDGEALNAMRMANSKLKAAGLTWQDVMSSNNPHAPANPYKEYSKPKGDYRYKEAPKSFASSFFRATMDCKEFISSLDKDNVAWINKLINFFNDHRYLPQSAWTNFIELWDNFREQTRG